MVSFYINILAEVIFEVAVTGFPNRKHRIKKLMFLGVRGVSGRLWLRRI